MVFDPALGRQVLRTEYEDLGPSGTSGTQFGRPEDVVARIQTANLDGSPADSIRVERPYGRYYR